MADVLTGPSLAGLLLAGGAVFLVAAGSPSLVRVWTGPPEEGLPLIHSHRRAWRLANLGFALGTVLTSAGLWLVSDAVGDRGAPLARAAAATYSLGAALWLTSLCVRLAVTPAKASAYVATRTIDSSYAPLDRLAGGLFTGFTYLAGAALLGVGTAILAGGVVAAPVAWFALVIGAVVIIGYLAFGDMPPFVSYLPTTLIGVALLLGWH
jgi:hypothetical protein